MATSNTTPVVIPQPIAAQATSENINVIPNGATGTNLASFQEGFPAITRMPVIENPLPTQVSGLPPKQQDFNGLFNVVSQHNFFAQNGGTYSFNQAVSDAIGGYPKNAVLWYFLENEDPCLVYSLINDNTNNFVEDPTLIDGEHWKKLSLGGGSEIGDIGFAPLGIDESENKRRYLNGQVIIQSQFVSFTNKVKAAVALYPSLATTETNWQAEKTNSKLGQCGKFVVDDTAGTIRLPCVVNAQGLVDLQYLGTIKNESLPNHYHENFTNEVGAGEGITASTSPTMYNNENGLGAAIMRSGSNLEPTVGKSSGVYGSSTYQDNAPVQQEAIQYPYYIVVNTGVEEAERPINNYQVNNVYSYGMSQYYKGTMNNNSWLKSSGQWNDGNVYTGMYNWLLEQMNAGVSGFVASTAAYTDYDFVINTADQTFRLPLLNGEESWVGNTSSVLSTSDIVSETQFTWTATKNGFVKFTCYDSITQVVICYINGQVVFHGGIAVPSGAVTPRPSFCVKVKKDDIVSIKAESEILTNVNISFIPAVGNGSLYYYVGDTLQNADLINVARIEETIVDKADTDLSNCTKPYVTETYRNGDAWYRVYSDGWIEQGGLGNAGLNIVHTLLKPFSNANYTITATPYVAGSDTTNAYAVTIKSKATSSFTSYLIANYLHFNWKAEGQGA